MTSSVQTLNMSNFMEKIGNEEKLVVLEFTGPWSEPCKYMKPKLQQLANKKKDKAVFYAIDINEFKYLSERFAVEVLPTFLVVYKCYWKRTVVGVDCDELEKAIDDTSRKISSSST